MMRPSFFRPMLGATVLMLGVALAGSGVSAKSASAVAPSPAPLASPVASQSAMPGVPPPQGASTAESLDLVRRAASVNANLRSYVADVRVDVALKSFPFLSTSLDGEAYYERPDKEAIVFDHVPALAGEFKKVYPKLDPPGSWSSIYRISVDGDLGGVTTFRLEPLHPGRVAHLDVKVDDRTATIGAYTWTYVDGGTVSFTQNFLNRDGNALVAAQTGRVDLPSYKADVVSHFSKYRLNVAVPSDVFGTH